MRLTAALSVLFLLSACGPTSVPAAQNLATEATCDWYEKCDEIGADKTYQDRQECEVASRNAFQDVLWPEGQCMKIDQEAFDTCLDRIRGTTCGNPLDFLTTLSICSANNVCTE
ncbi:MAG: DUF6184 family natural product biosynthesis lipoprotein [Myxococcaceae bacterium]|nr:DUF6184 family natural product biosynthesis lipoprotein [Myxococcaceae bacterium]MCI0671382.1 DUF6184 family natural product biosynthesis lipoprotein [Myxococcaceae bacterium]